MTTAHLQVECPVGSGDFLNLVEVAEEIQHRIIHIFGRDLEGKRSCNGGNPKLDHDPHFRDLVWFHEVRLPELFPFRHKLKLCSSSTVTTDAELVLLIKPDGMHLVFQSVPVRCF